MSGTNASVISLFHDRLRCFRYWMGVSLAIVCVTGAARRLPYTGVCVLHTAKMLIRSLMPILCSVQSRVFKTRFAGYESLLTNHETRIMVGESCLKKKKRSAHCTEIFMDLFLMFQEVSIYSMKAVYV